MKAKTLILAMSAASAAAGFDYDAWQQRRAGILDDADRLRACHAECAANEMAPAEDVVVPVEEHPDGSLKLVIYAKKAKYFLTKGLVWAEGVTVKKLDADGSLDSQIDAASCVVDRSSKSGWAEGAAKFIHGKTTFEGQGVYFSSSNNYLRVYGATDVISKDLKLGGGGFAP